MGFHAEGFTTGAKPGQAERRRARAAPTRRSSTTATTASAGASSARRGAPADQAQARLRGRRRRPSRTGASPASSSTRGTAGRASPPPRWPVRWSEIARLGGGTVESFPEDSRGPQGLRLVPAQRHARAVRTPRFRARPPARQAPLAGHSDGSSNVTSTCARLSRRIDDRAALERAAVGLRQLAGQRARPQVLAEHDVELGGDQDQVRVSQNQDIRPITSANAP